MTSTSWSRAARRWASSARTGPARARSCGSWPGSAPDAGTVRVAQPVAPILELGLGFHPDFTGRQNAVLYGALLGIRRKRPGDDAEHLDDVLQQLRRAGEFADQPLRTHSSGMSARLAFAVATNVEPQVLVVDEALAVGDGGFQKKCVDRR